MLPEGVIFNGSVRARYFNKKTDIVLNKTNNIKIHILYSTYIKPNKLILLINFIVL
jgi:hypothetical protein